MKYSFVMPVYNREKLVTQALHSLIMQDFDRSEFEIIVIDDNSSDGSAQIINTLITEYNHQFIIRYYKNLENYGEGYSRDKGINLAQGDIIIQTEDDAYYPRDYLSKIDKEIEDLEKRGVKWGTLIVLPRKSLNFDDGIIPKFVQFRRQAIVELTKINKRPVIGGWIFKKNIYKKAGGYSNLKIGTDVALVKKIKDLGYLNLAIYDTFWCHTEPVGFIQFFNRQYRQGRGYWDYRKFLRLPSSFKQKSFWLVNAITLGSIFFGMIFLLLQLRFIELLYVFFYWYLYNFILVIINRELRLTAKNILISEYKLLIFYLPVYYGIEIIAIFLGRLREVFKILWIY